MKRKLSFLIALVMVLSMLPAMSVSAATKNEVLIAGGIVSDDRAWAKDAPGIPVISIKEDSSVAVPSGTMFTLTLVNAEWNGVRGTTDTVASGGTVAGLTNAGWGYSIEYVTNTSAIVHTGTLTTPGTSAMRIQLPVELQGEGPAKVIIDNTGTTSITSGEYTFATGASGGTVTTIEKSDTTFSNTLNVPEIVITETTFDVIEAGILELTAPAGFEWVKTGNENARWYLGFAPAGNAGAAAFTLKTGDAGVMQVNLAGLPTSTTRAGAIAITGLRLAREGTIAETALGDVRVRVSRSGVTTQTIVVGIFANRGVTITAEDKALPEIVNGKYPLDHTADEIRVLNVTIEETSRNAWNDNTDATFTLSDGAKFRGAAVAGTTRMGALLSTSDEVGLSTNGAGAARAVPTANSSSPNSNRLKISENTLTISSGTRSNPNETKKVELKIWVSVEPGFEGDIIFQSDVDNEAFGGNISATVGKAINPVTVTTTSTPINIGYLALDLADVTIKENQAGALIRYSSANPDIYGFWTETATRMSIGRYGGVGFKDVDKAEVISGDIVLDSVKVPSGASYVEIRIKRESTVASEIKISGLTMDVDRSVPEGKLNLRLGGGITANFWGTTKPSDNDGKQGGFDVQWLSVQDDYVNIVTAAPDRNTAFTTEVAVTIGSTTIVIDGIEAEVDVAPFIQDGYTMVPVRAVIMAMGLRNEQIVWDTILKTVTIMDNRSRVVQYQVGSNWIKVNGSDIPFEGPSVMNVQGRTFIPFRALGEIVLGCPVSWDEATRTAHYNKVE